MAQARLKVLDLYNVVTVLDFTQDLGLRICMFGAHGSTVERLELNGLRLPELQGLQLMVYGLQVLDGFGLRVLKNILQKLLFNVVESSKTDWKLLNPTSVIHHPSIIMKL